MASAPPKLSAKASPPRVAEVLSTAQLTPQMIRVVLGGAGLSGFGSGPFSDGYVKLQFPPAGSTFGPPFDLAQIKSTQPREQWPRVRTYSIRAWDPGRLELTIDFVNHGGSGVAGPWAACASPGDLLQFVGPGGGYVPDPTADWHLMVGDACVVPAISASLARVRAGSPVHVVLSVDGPEEEQELVTPGDLHLTWLHHDPAAESEAEPLLDVVEALDFGAGRLSAFVHGEAGAVRALRRHLIAERQIPVEQLSISGYWKRRRTEEGWREDKAEWKRQVEEDLKAL